MSWRYRQIEKSDVVMSIDEFAPLAGHYQIASPPDRGEPGAGEMSYPYLLQCIDDIGFDGWVAASTGRAMEPSRG